MRIACTRKHERYSTDSPHIRSHIVALHTVATGNSLGEATIDVGERDTETVVLHLAAHLEILASQSLLHGVVPVAHVLLRIGVGQRQHGVLVRHLTELRLQVATHALRRRIGIGHLGMAGFQVLQFVHQLVEVIVADTRLVQHVIPVVVLMQLAPQLLYPLFLVHELSDNHFFAVNNIKAFTNT